ncbi:MAG TPA: glycerate kinase [Pseudolabrys sp.]|nr:glycerate kinase [Pseudolabrys sp.]
MQSSESGLRAFLAGLYSAAVAAAHPRTFLAPLLPPPPRGRVILLAAGKAAGSMSEVAESHYLDHVALPAERFSGIAVARRGYGRRLRHIRMLEAGHPIPDAVGVEAAAVALKLADEAQHDDLVLVLISGGASANWISPADGISLEDKKAVTQALLRSGADIGEINAVRKHLSRIKGGRLALHARPAKLLTIAISDVPGDDPSAIGSGPTVPDPTTLADARAVIAKYKLHVPPTISRALLDASNESPKPGQDFSIENQFILAAKPQDAMRAAETSARAAGYDCIYLGDCVEGEAREVAAVHAQIAREVRAQGRRAIILSGGELTVTIRGSGRGGPNQEYALALALGLSGMEAVAALAADTDGTDGGGGDADDPAGAFVDGQTASRARELGLDPAAFLADNNSSEFFNALGDLLTPGPTYTNVNDFRAIVVGMPQQITPKPSMGT